MATVAIYPPAPAPEAEFEDLTTDEMLAHLEDFHGFEEGTGSSWADYLHRHAMREELIDAHTEDHELNDGGGGRQHYHRNRRYAADAAARGAA